MHSSPVAATFGERGRLAGLSDLVVGQTEKAERTRHRQETQRLHVAQNEAVLADEPRRRRSVYTVHEFSDADDATTRKRRQRRNQAAPICRFPREHCRIAVFVFRASLRGVDQEPATELRRPASVFDVFSRVEDCPRPRLADRQDREASQGRMSPTRQWCQFWPRVAIRLARVLSGRCRLIGHRGCRV